jgi:ubiquinone/menaquinone biosynthesis C-methylase UbiE
LLSAASAADVVPFCNKRFVRARAKDVAHALLALVPERHRYRVRSSIEKLAFNFNPPVGNLPAIFHYWSNAHLRPRLEEAGFSSPEDFFFQSLCDRIRNQAAPARMLSIGSGRCELEVSLARRLSDSGLDQFRIVCMDINSEMLSQAKAASVDVALKMEFRAADVKTLSRDERFDVVLANQCLHHIVELETLFDTIASLISDGGVFLTSDVIGRNGHQMWPEALNAFQHYWQHLPRKYKFDNARGFTASSYVNYDHAKVGFEGVRAQDVLPLMIERFSFEVFLAHTSITMPFVERRFGYNFDPRRTFDRSFIDEVAQHDRTLVDSGQLAPTQMIARVSTSPSHAITTLNGRTPKQCVRWPDR